MASVSNPEMEHEIASDNGDQGGARPQVSLMRLIFSCMVAGGIQYGWALQLSLLTPYVQTLGISHTLSSMIWLCGPIAGFFVQPLVGMWSDKCRSRFGRRRPFILVGCLIICIAVTGIGFSSDFGFVLGDTKEHCSVYQGPRWKAAFIFIAGFWVLDFSNNAVQGPARALMADLSGPNRCNTANAIFCSWMAFGNILGYSSGASGKWYRLFPFLQTKACCEACANLKGAFLVAVVFLILCTIVTLVVAKETLLCDLQRPGRMTDKDNTNVEGSGFIKIFRAFTQLPKGMNKVLAITALTWLSWFPFILYDTDWMGREVYHGNPSGTQAEIKAYDTGVRQGALGLLLNSVIIGVTSFIIEPMCRKLTAKTVWVMSNFTVFIGMAAISILGMVSMKGHYGAIEQVVGVDERVKYTALFIFTALGFPLAILYSVPFAYTAQLAANHNGGQGLCTGVLNISIVIPQMIIALGAGPWDSLFNKGNTPAFALASVIAFCCGIAGLFLLPNLPKSNFRSAGFGGH